jgi:hypothetical protein
MHKPGSQWDPFKLDQNELAVVVARGSNGKVDHCISIAKGFLFDSNFKHAVALNRDTMDLVCSDDKHKCLYVDYVLGLTFPNYKSYIEKMKETQLQKKKGKKERKKNITSQKNETSRTQQIPQQQNQMKTF